MSEEFLGRQYDDKTATWVFADGSGRLPDEMRIDVFNAIDNRNIYGGNAVPVLGALFNWKDRISANAAVVRQARSDCPSEE